MGQITPPMQRFTGSAGQHTPPQHDSNKGAHVDPPHVPSLMHEPPEQI